MKYVLDTNIFNRILDNSFDLSSLPSDAIFVATKIQLEELEKTKVKDPIRGEELVATFQSIDPKMLPASFSWGIAGAGWGEGTWSDGKVASELHAALEAIKSRNNNWQDALIAEVAFESGYCLVTADKILAEVAKKYGVTVHYVAP